MRIFVSYNNRDISTAERVVKQLGDALPGFGAYFAPRSNIGGAYWLPQLGEELKRSDVVLLLLGTQVGPWQELEYYEALRLNRACGAPRIVPVLLGEESPGLWFISQFHRLRLDRQRLGGLIEQIRVAVEGTVAAGDRVPPWRETNPYRGLRAMGSADAAWFFGRDELTGDIIEALRTRSHRVLVLVGNSGVGKSSIVEAGVLAALRSQFWPGDLDRAWPADLRDSRSWLVISIRPGERPLKALALGVVRSWLDDPAEAEAQAMKWVGNFRNGSDLAALAEAARHAIAQRTAAEPPARILLHVDQGEELYARSEAGEAALFSELVARAPGRDGLAVMISLRSDYYGRLQEDARLFATSERIDVPPLGLEEIEAVVRQPADRLGASFETRDVAPLIAEATVRESGALPLLSFLMSEAWDMMRNDEASDGVLRFPLGVVNVAGPLVRRAETFLETHPGNEAALRRLFTLRLAHVPKEGEPIRRRSTRAELSSSDGSEWRLAEELASADWRLLTTGSEVDVPVVEVAHEVLLRKWPRLTGWIDQEREFLIWKGQLEVARREWKATPIEKKDDAVLMGLALETARRWMSERGGDLPKADAAFVRRSEEVEQARRAEEAQRAHDLAAERERSRRRAVWISRITAAAAILLLVMGGLAGWLSLSGQKASEQAAIEAGRAEAERGLVIANQLATTAKEVFSSGPGDSAAAAMIAIDSLQRRPTPEGIAAIRNVLSLTPTPPEPVDLGWATAVSLSADDRVAAWIKEDGGAVTGAAFTDVAVLDPDSFEVDWQETIRGSAEAAMTPDGNNLAVGGATREVIAGLTQIGLKNPSPTDGDTAVLFSDDGHSLYVIHDSGRIDVRTSPDWRVERRLSFPRNGRLERLSARITGDNNILVILAGNYQKGSIVEVPLDGRKPYPVPIRIDPKHSSFSKGGRPWGIEVGNRWAASSHDDGSTRVWRTGHSEIPKELRIEGGIRLTARSTVSSDGTIAAAIAHYIGDESDVTIWSAGGTSRINGWHHFGSATELAFSPDGAWLAAGGEGGLSMRLVAGGEVRRWLTEETVSALTYEPGGSLLVGTESGRVMRLDPVDGRILADRRFAREVLQVAVSPIGGRIVVSMGDWISNWTDIRITDRSTGERIAIWSVNGDVSRPMVSPNGKFLAAEVSPPGELVIWRLADGGVHFRAPIDGAFRGFDATGQRLVFEDGSLAVYDATTGAPVGRFGEQGGIGEARWSTDADHVVTRSSSVGYAGWDLLTGDELWRAIEGEPAASDWRSADGRFAASYEEAIGRIEVLDAKTGSTIASLQTQIPNAVALSNTADRMLVSYPVEPNENKLAGASRLALIELPEGREIWSMKVNTKGSGRPFLVPLPDRSFVAWGLGADEKYGRPWLYYVPKAGEPWIASKEMMSQYYYSVGNSAAGVLLYDYSSIELHNASTGRIIWQRPRAFGRDSRSLFADFARDNKSLVLAEGGYQGSRIRVISVESNTELFMREIEGHLQDVRVASDGKTFVVALQTADGGALSVRDMKTGEEQSYIKLDRAPYSIKLLSDLESAAVLDVDSVLEVRNLRTGAPVRRISMKTRADEWDMTIRANRAVTLLGERLRVWNVYTAEEVASMIDAGELKSPRISPDGSLIAYFRESEATGSAVMLWEAETSTKRSVPAQSVSDLVFSPDGVSLAIESNERLPGRIVPRAVRVVDVNTLATQISIHALPKGQILWSGFSGDGRYLLVVERGRYGARGVSMHKTALRVFEMASGLEIARRAVSGSVVEVTAKGSDVFYLSEDRRMQVLRLPVQPLDPLLLRLVDNLAGDSLATARDSTKVLVHSPWEANQVIDPRSGRTLELVKKRNLDQFQIEDGDLSSDGRYALLSIREGRTWEGSTGDLIVRNALSGEEITSLHRNKYYNTVRLAGSEIVVASEIGSSYVDAPDSELLWWNWKDGSVKILESNNPVTDVVVNQDGTHFATAESSLDDRSDFRPVGIQRVRVWDTKTATVIFSIPTDLSFAELAFSPDNRYLAIAGKARGLLVDLETGKPALTIGPSAEASGPNLPNVANEVIPNLVNRLWPGFASNGGEFVLVGETHVIFYDFATGETERIEEPVQIERAVFSRDGEYVALVAGDTARLWNLVKRELVASIPVPGLWRLAFAGPDARNLIADGEDGIYRLVWRPEELIDRACQVFRGDVWEESRFRVTGATDPSGCQNTFNLPASPEVDAR